MATMEINVRAETLMETLYDMGFRADNTLHAISIREIVAQALVDERLACAKLCEDPASKMEILKSIGIEP